MAASRSPRDDLDLFERLSRLDAATLSDADKSLKILPPAIRPVSANARLLGRAVTADAPDDLLSVLAGLQAACPGDVLVVSANGSANAVAGELFANEASRRGLAGLVLDGYCRDSRSLRRMNLPIFARGATPHAAPAKAPPSINVPLTIEGVRVNPGDLLVGDEDGILVATPDELAAAVHAAETIQVTEEALVSSMTDGVPLFDMLNFAEHVRKVSASEDSTLQFLL